ncbi:hypothetical protein Tco_0133626 [Tanacetum coccineum]
MMLVHHDQWDKILVTMTSVARILRDKIGAENLRKTKHEVPHRCDDKTVDITDYKDSDHKDEEKEEVPMEDDEIDDEVDHSNTNEALQWSLAKHPFIVCMELNEQSSFVLHTIPSSISNELVQVDAHGVMLGLYLATWKPFKSELVGYHMMDGLF